MILWIKISNTDRLFYRTLTMSASQLLFDGGIQRFIPRVCVRIPSRDWERKRELVFVREHVTISCIHDKGKQIF